MWRWTRIVLRRQRTVPESGKLVMFKHLIALALVALAAAFVSPAVAQQPPGTSVGTLACNMAPSIGLIFGSRQRMACRFTPNGSGPPEAYVGVSSWIDAEDAFRLHDTYGFPYDLTRELLQSEGLAVDDAGFHELMEEQRERARTGAARAHGAEGEHEQVRRVRARRRASRRGSSATRPPRCDTSVGALKRDATACC